jgi:DNA gyrase subunit A
MIINKSGLAIRMSIENLRVMGRATQGVKLINLKGGDAIAAVAKVMQSEEIIENSDEAETPDPNDEISDGTTIVNDTEE